MTSYKVDRAGQSGRRGARGPQISPPEPASGQDAPRRGDALRSGSGLVHWRDAGADKPLCGRPGSYTIANGEPDLHVTCKDCARALAAGA